jgi:hypothetical protein
MTALAFDFDREAFIGRLDALDRVLTSHAFPATSPWWREQTARFVRSARRRWVVRAGRRAGKSSTLCRLAVGWALWGGWQVPPGDTAVIAFVSIDRGEASARLKTIAAILRALGVAFDERGDELELRDRRLVFRVVTSSIRGAVGFTSVAVFGDEVARWENREQSANPAKEVVGSLAPTLATQRAGFMVLSSSPWSTEDFHCEAFDRGDTAHQVTSFAPTWIANPTITEEQSHELEPDPRVWRREYAAEPSAALSAALDPEAIRDAHRPMPEGLVMSTRALGLDFSAGRGDACVWLAGAWGWEPGAEPPYLAGRASVYTERDGLIPYWEPILDADGKQIPNPQFTGGQPLFVVSTINHVVGAFWQRLPSHELVGRIAADARAWGTSHVFGDQHSSYLLPDMFGGLGLGFSSIAWTNPLKVQAVGRLRRWLRDRQLILPPPTSSPAAERLYRELLAFRERLTPSGAVTFQAAGGQHDDHVAALLTLAMADALGTLPRSPAGAFARDQQERRVRAFANSLPPR